MAGEMTVELEGKSYNLDDFELGDLEWLEEHVGKPLSAPETLSSMKAAVGLVYLIKKQSDPEFTLDHARKLKLSVFSSDESENGSKPKRPTKASAGS